MINLTILGIGCRRSIALKDNVLEALKSLPAHIHVEEVTDVDELMKYDISATPALLINGRVVAQDRIPSVEEVRQLIREEMEKPVVLLHVRNILVPTDFSETSRYAFQYALKLAQMWQAAVRVVHFYQPEYDAANPYLSEPVSAQTKGAERTLETFTEDIPVEQEVIIGYAPDEIEKMSRSGQYDLIVMGTTGEGSLIEKVFGSVALQVAQRSQIPVLFIPNSVTFRKPANLMAAARLSGYEEKSMGRIAQLAHLLNAHLHVVHVVEPRDESPANSRLGELENLFQKYRNGQEIHFADIRHTSVPEGLNQYALEHKVDIVAVTPRYRNFFEKLIHRSVTKRLLINSKLPLMVVQSV